MGRDSGPIALVLGNKKGLRPFLGRDPGPRGLLGKG
jgi:hypothetical protein